MMKKTGAQIVVESLKKEGVDTLFNYPGGAVLQLFHELDQSSIRQILVRHEQAAVHAADGYARSSGKVGVVLVTSGPGATNTVTGIATAHMDSIPIVVLTGQIATPLIGNDAFQEADIVGITRPCTKHNYLVKDVKDLASTLKEAFYIARNGRPGPVLVDLPKDILADSAEFKYPEKVFIRGYQPTYEGHPGQIERAIRLIMKVEEARPLCRGRNHLLQCLEGTDPPFRKTGNSCDHDAHGARQHSRHPSPLSWNVRDARNLSGQYGGDGVRSPDCHRGPFR